MEFDFLFDQVHIIAFNRPDYFRQVAQSISNQIQKCGNAVAVHVWIDGFKGSKDESICLLDRTPETAAIALSVFPDVHIHRHQTNIGVARIFERAESLARRRSFSPYALFFEEDYVLGPQYLDGLCTLMKWGLGHDEVALLTAHGIAFEYIVGGDISIRAYLPASLAWPHSLWAFAIKVEHLRERTEYIQGYLRTMQRQRYWKRDHQEILNYHASKGNAWIPGSSQDYAKHAAMLYHGRIAVTLPYQLGRYIGERGEHSSPRVYKSLGYNNFAMAESEICLGELASKLPLSFDRSTLSWMRVQELLFIKLSNSSESLSTRIREQAGELRRCQTRVMAMHQQIQSQETVIRNLENQIKTIIHLTMRAARMMTRLATLMARLVASK